MIRVLRRWLLKRRWLKPETMGDLVLRGDAIEAGGESGYAQVLPLDRDAAMVWAMHRNRLLLQELKQDEARMIARAQQLSKLLRDRKAGLKK